jgi:hypothetical protein
MNNAVVTYLEQKLVIEQTTIAGDGGGSNGGQVGRVGNSTSQLTIGRGFARNESVKARVISRAGSGGYTTGSQNAGDGGQATGDLDLTATDEVEGHLTVTGGTGGSLINASTSNPALQIPSGSAGAGRSIALENAARGVAEKAVRLHQEAIAGHGGFAYTGSAGAAGDATSRMQINKAQELIDVTTTATAGHGGGKEALAGLAANGGQANAETILTNPLGDTLATANSTGGGGGGASGRVTSGEGGIATSIAKSSTAGARSLASSTATSRGGNGGTINNSGTIGSNGGNATSLAESSTTGRGTVSAISAATGGAGAGVWPSYYSGAGGRSAHGGNATAAAIGRMENATTTPSDYFTVNAVAMGGAGGSGRTYDYADERGGNGGNGGSARATAEGYGISGGDYEDLKQISAVAYGGAGGTAIAGYRIGLGGDASAEAFGQSADRITVSASATGGMSPGILIDGDATAKAVLNSSTLMIGSLVESSANSSGGLFTTLSASATAAGAGSAAIAPGLSTTESRAMIGRSFYSNVLPPGRQASTFVVGQPRSGDVIDAVEGHPLATAMLAGADTLALMRMSCQSTPTTSGASQTYTSHAAFQIDFTQLASSEDLQLAALNPTAIGSGFDSLRLEVSVYDRSVIDSTYTSVAEALTSFNDCVFNFGDIEAGTIYNTVNVSVRMTLTTDDPTAGFSTMFVLANSPLAPLPGDFNQNGVVDAADYTVWREAIESHAYNPLADGNRDGHITWADAEVWRTNFGRTRTLAPVVTAAPEPTALLILAIGFIALRSRFVKAKLWPPA